MVGGRTLGGGGILHDKNCGPQFWMHVFVDAWAAKQCAIEGDVDACTRRVVASWRLGRVL